MTELDEKGLEAARSALLQPSDGGFAIDLRAAILAYEANRQREAGGLSIGSRLTVDGVEAVVVQLHPTTHQKDIGSLVCQSRDIAHEVYRAMLSAAGGK